MAIIGINRGSGARNTGGESTYSFSPASDVSKGSRLVVCLAMDNAAVGGGGPYAVATAGTMFDSVGNTYTYQTRQTASPGNTANDGVSTGIFDSLLDYPLRTTDTITITLSATTVARSYTLTEFQTDNPNWIVTQVWSGGVGGSGANTTPSKASEQPPATGEMLIGVMGAEMGDGTITVDSDTTNGDWSTAQNANVGTTTTGVEISSQYKLITTGGAQTFNQTITSADWASVMAVYTESPLEITNRGSGSRNTGAETNYVITPGSDFRAGTRAVLQLSYDNSGTNGADPFNTITDSLGNTWATDDSQLNDPGAANAGNALRTFSSLLTTPLTTANTITVDFGANTTVARAYILWEIKAKAGFVPAFLGNTSEATGSSTTPTITRTAVGIPVGALVLGVMGAQHGDATVTADSDTTSGSWSVGILANVGTTTAGVKIYSQHKHLLTSADQTFNQTITSSTWCTMVVLYVVVLPNIVFNNYKFIKAGNGMSVTEKIR